MRFHRSFPVERGAADRQAIRTALERLADGHAVCVFPEGTRSHSARLARGFPGVGLLALRSGAPVLPVGIAGSELPFRLWPRPTVVIRLGPPIAAAELAVNRRDHQAVVDQLMYRVAELLPPIYRGVYGLPPAVLAEADSPHRRAADGVAAHLSATEP